MPSENSEQVADLASLIASTQYQTVPADPSQGTQSGEEGVTTQADNQGQGVGNEGLSPVAGTVPDPAAGATGQDGVTNHASPGPTEPQNPDPRDQQIQQLTETIQNQTRFIQNLSAQQQAVIRAQQAREEQEFQARIRDMEPEEREAAMKDRELQRLRQRVQLTERAQQQSQADQQASAKSVVALMVAQESGLPPSAQRILVQAQTPEQMEQIAQDLVAQGYGRQQATQPSPQPGQQVQQGYINQYHQTPTQNSQQAQQQPEINPAHLGGDAAPSSNIAPKIEPGSGDLMGLIQQTPWTAIQG